MRRTLLIATSVLMLCATEARAQWNDDRNVIAEDEKEAAPQPSTTSGMSRQELPPEDRDKDNDDAISPAKMRLFDKKGYAGVLSRFLFCTSGCEGWLPSVGAEVGYQLIGVGFRIGFQDGGTFIFPDIRLHYDFRPVPQLAITPFFEMTPAYAKSGDVEVFQFILRPGIRVGIAATPNIMFVLEPMAFDLGVYSSASSEGRSISSNEVVTRYVFGGGVQYRF